MGATRVRPPTDHFQGALALFVTIASFHKATDVYFLKLVGTCNQYYFMKACIWSSAGEKKRRQDATAGFMLPKAGYIMLKNVVGL